MTSILSLDPAHFSLADLLPVAQALGQGDLVAFPTETVYGLGGHALDPGALAKIFAAKGRPATNPLIVHVPAKEALAAVVSCWPQEAEALAQAFWPGPLTLVLPKHPGIPDLVTAGLPHVAVRIPAHPVALALLEVCGMPLCAPSANRYTSLSPTHPDHVLAGLGGRIAWLVAAGPTSVGIESTVLSLLNPRHPVILRPGVLGPHDLQAVLPDHTISHRPPTPHDPALPMHSPGLARRHYAPRATLHLFDEFDQLPGSPADLGVVSIHRPPPWSEFPHSVTLGDDPTFWARHLYATLHQFDAQGCPVVYVQRPPKTEPWRAIWDRLERAHTSP